MICRICDSQQLDLAIDLGEHPWCNHFLTAAQVGHEPRYPLHVVYCRDCSTVQLDYSVPKETMFGDHTYLSGVTRSLSEHFRQVAREIDARFLADKTQKSILDIGSNDGTQLQHFKAMGYDVLGVESSKTTARIAEEQGIDTVNAFFNADLAATLGRKFDVINAAGVFFHLEELHSVTEGIRAALRDDGVFVVQFLYMKRIVENMAFDQIYHEHLLYYNLKTIEVLLNRHGLSMFDAYLSPIHGGSIIGYITHQGRGMTPSARLERMRAAEVDAGANDYAYYQAFSERIKQMKEENIALLSHCKAQGKSIYGMGAPVKGNTLLNYFGVGTNYLDVLVEKNELRRGLFSPGMHIPIVIEKELERLPDIYYVLAWNFKKEILQNNQHLLEQGIEFLFPIDPREITE